MICYAAAQLHNFVIDNDQIVFNTNATELEEFGANALDDGPEYNRGYLINLPDRDKENGNPRRRQELLSEIISKNLKRPEHNLRQNNKLDEESVFASNVTCVDPT